MRFAAPEFLWFLLLVPVLALGSAWSYGRKRRALSRFAGGAALIARAAGDLSPHRRAVKLLLLYVGIVALPLALARPQWGTRLEPVTRVGADVVIVVDTSLSMATEDLTPSRLEQARHAIDSLLRRLEGDRVALVSFAGQAALNCPLTPDQAAVRLFLDALDVHAVSTPGTALGDALATALAALRVDDPRAGGRGRAVVLFSDGEDHAGKLEEAQAAYQRHGIPIHVVGCGTTNGGPIPLRDPTGVLTGYKKDREGKVVTSRLEETVLEGLALASGGRYYRATAAEVEIEDLAVALAGLDAGEIGAQLRTRYEDRFQYPLGLGLAALLTESLLGDRRRRRTEREST